MIVNDLTIAEERLDGRINAAKVDLATARAEIALLREEVADLRKALDRAKRDVSYLLSVHP